jgi:hypothetical protein
MDYSILKKIAASKRVSLKKLAVLIDMTETGFFAAMKNDTMSVKKLEKCAQVLGCTICDFFVCTGSNSADDGYKAKYYELLEKDHSRIEAMVTMKNELDALRKKKK